jgi:DNA-binding MarR family transcriptional regulator
MSDTTMTIEEVALRLNRLKLGGHIEDIARLHLIKANPEWRRQRVIAQNLGMHNPGMHRFVARMVARGLLKAEREKKDKRQVDVTVTAAGSAYLRFVEKKWSKGG